MPLYYLPLYDPFLNYLRYQKRYSQHTIIAYQNDLVSFFDFIEVQFGELPVTQIKATFVKS